MNNPTFLGLQEVVWVGFQAVGAFAGLIVLGIYAFDTRRIREATLNQSSASRRPFFILTTDSPMQGVSVWQIKNVGVGPALETTWEYKDPILREQSLTQVGAVAPGSVVTIREANGPIGARDLTVRGGLRITYTDTAGKVYWSEIGCKDEYGSVRFVVETGDGILLS